MEKNEYLNYELCKKCGGKCCKMSACMFFVDDFESMKLDYLESILDTGRISIKSSLDFKSSPKGEIVVVPKLYLIARSIDRDVIDLVSIPNTCANLEESGCYFSEEERPSGGLYLIPKENGKCHSLFNGEDVIKKYEPYQKVLQRIIKRRTGLSVYAKISEDIENLFYDLLSGKIDKELYDDIFGDIHELLIKIYNKEYLRACAKYRKENPMLLLKRKDNI